METNQTMSDPMLFRSPAICGTCDRFKTEETLYGVQKKCGIDNYICGPWNSDRMIPGPCPRRMETIVFNDHKQEFIKKHGLSGWTKKQAWKLCGENED